MSDTPAEPATVYCGIEIAEFEARELGYDVFVRLSDDKYVKVATPATPLTLSRIEAYKAKNVKQLYITRENFTSYLGLAGKKQERLSPEDEVTFQMLATDASSSLELLRSNELNELLFDTSVATATNVVAMACSNRSFMALIDAMNRENGGVLFKHTLAVSVFSAMIAQAMGWTTPSKIHVLALGGFLHDLGEQDTGIKIPGRSPKLLSGRELTKNEAHTRIGAEKLATVGTVPSDVTDIILQHHENCLGTGYPGKLSKARIHPMARIVSAAEAFCELILPEPGGPHMAPQDAIRDLLVTDELDNDVVLALRKVYDTDGKFVPPTDASGPGV